RADFPVVASYQEISTAAIKASWEVAMPASGAASARRLRDRSGGLTPRRSQEFHHPGLECVPRSTMLHPAMAFIPSDRAFSSTAALELPGLNHTCLAGFVANSGSTCKRTSGGR